MLRHEARQRQVSTYSARLTWYASSSTGVRRKEGWWLFGGGICSTHSIYGCKVKWHFFLKALLSARKNRKESDPVRHCMNDGPGQSDEWASSTSFDTTQFCPHPPPSTKWHPKIQLELLIFLQETSRWPFSPTCVKFCLHWKVHGMSFRLIRWLIRLKKQHQKHVLSQI